MSGTKAAPLLDRFGAISGHIKRKGKFGIPCHDYAEEYRNKSVVAVASDGLFVSSAWLVSDRGNDYAGSA
jgi:hypothetical protein